MPTELFNQSYLWYKLDEAIVTEPVRDTQMRLDATISNSGANVSVVAGRTGNARSFKGTTTSDGVLAISNFPAMTQATFLVDVHMEGNFPASGREIIINSNNSAYGIYEVLKVDNLGRVGSDLGVSTYTIPNNQWVRLVGTISGSEYVLYACLFDGTVTEVLRKASTTKFYTRGLAQGGNGEATSGLKGAIDNFAVWNRVLTLAEITELCTNDPAPDAPIADPAPPAGQYTTLRGRVGYVAKSDTDLTKMGEVRNLTDNEWRTGDTFMYASGGRGFLFEYDVDVTLTQIMLKGDASISYLYYWNASGVKTAVSLSPSTYKSDGVARALPATYTGVRKVLLYFTLTSDKTMNSIELYSNTEVLPPAPPTITNQLLKNDIGDYYTYKNSVLTNLGNVRSEELFKTNGMTKEEVNAIPASVMKTLSYPVVETWTDNASHTPRSITFKVVPQDVLLVANEDVDLSVVERTDKMILEYMESGQGKLRIAFSGDGGVNWYGAGYAKLTEFNETTVLNSGMTPAEFTSATNSFDSFIKGNGDKIRFAYLLSVENFADVAKVGKLTIQVDLIGSYNIGKLDTDFTMSYQNQVYTIKSLLTHSGMKVHYFPRV